MTGFSVGIVGLDAMGGALSRRFDQEGVGHSATDLNSRMLQAHLANGGSAPAGSPYDLAQMCNLIFMTETSDDMLRESVTGPTGLYHRLQPGTLIVDMSDVSPQTGQGLARSVVSKGAAWIEATPVGGPSNVRNGNLTLLLAGPQDHIESIRPVLQSFAAKTLRLGELGSGGLAKSLAASLGLASLLLHTEFMATARKLGLDPEQTLRQANGKFERRFRKMEQNVTEAGRRMEHCPLDDLEEAWQRAKRDLGSGTERP